ncbi:MAG: ABC transporter substrate-binding protein [Verrucomicrobiota bacterium]
MEKFIIDWFFAALLLLHFAFSSEARAYTVGFSQCDTAESDWRKANTRSFHEAAQELNIHLLFRDAHGNSELQRKQLLEMIEQKVDAIVLSANELQGWDELLLKAKAAKIPVVLSDRSVKLAHENQNKGLYVAWIGSDVRYQGRVAASWLAAETAGHCNIVEILGPLEAGPSIERARGFREVANLFPGMKILGSKSGMWRADEAKKAMKAFLREEGANIHVVFALNDNMAFGAAEAIEEEKQLGLKPGNDILIIGIDAVKHGFELLMQKKLNALVECNPLLGRIVLKTVLEILSGRNVPPVTWVSDKVFTIHNAAEAFPSRKY